MTQPDQYTPTTAANYDSFAGFASATQADWQDLITGNVSGHFGAWSGMCALLEQVPFLGDIIEMGGGPNGAVWGPIGALFDGFTYFLESLCSLVLGGPSTGTTATSILTGATSFADIIDSSPLLKGFLTLVEDTGNLFSDMILGVMSFINILCGIANPAAVGDTTPNSIIGGFQGIFGIITNSPFLMGLIDLTQEAGSVVLQVLDGLVNFLDMLCKAISGNPSADPTTPGGVLGGVGSVMSLLLNNPITQFLIKGLEFTGSIILDILGAALQFFGDLFNVLFGILEDFLNPGGLLGFIGGIINSVFGIFNFGGSGSGGGIGGIANSLFGWAGDLLASIFGFPSLVGSGSTAAAAPNLLTNPGFETSTSLVGQQYWTWDGTNGHTSKGSAKTVCDGITHSLLSNAIHVTPGQVVNLKSWVKWSGLEASGQPISMMVNVYGGSSLLGTGVAATAPSGASHDWMELDGSFGVPETYGVGGTPSMLRLRLDVSEAATAGTVWFDDIYAGMPSQISGGLVSGLPGIGGGLGGAVQGILDMFTGLFTGQNNLIGTLITDLENAVSGFFHVLSGGSVGGGASTMYEVESYISNLLGSTSPIPGGNVVGQVPDSAVGGLGTIAGNITTAFNGWDPPASPDQYTQNQALGAMGTQAATVVGIAAEVQQMQVAINQLTEAAGGGGVTNYAFDDFQRTGTDLGADWSVTYSTGYGTWSTDGETAVFTGAEPGGVRDSVCRWVGDHSTSTDDYQKIDILISAAPTSSDTYMGYNDALGRINSTNTSFIRFRVAGDKTWILSCVVAGVETVWQTGTTVMAVGPGSIITLYCGAFASSSPRDYMVTCNSGLVTTYTEVGTVSGLGASYRGWGFGGHADGVVTDPQVVPGAVHQWGGSDPAAWQRF